MALKCILIFIESKDAFQLACGQSSVFGFPNDVRNVSGDGC